MMEELRTPTAIGYSVRRGNLPRKLDRMRDWLKGSGLDDDRNVELPLLLGWPHPLNTRTAVPREAWTLYPAQRHVTPGGIETSPGAAKTRLRRALSIP